MTENAERFVRNASRIQMWNAIVTPNDVDDIFNSCGGTLFCNGHLREVKTQNITDKTIKVYTVEMFN